jgi:dTDP-4-dehydrorhamnose reductase
VEVERQLRDRHPGALLVRTGPLFGAHGEHDLISILLHALELGKLVRLPADEWVSPTYVPELAHVALDLLLDGETGIWHLANPGARSWLDVAREAAGRASDDRAELIDELPIDEGAPSRPRCRALTSERGWLLAELDDALAGRVQDILAAGAPAESSSLPVGPIPLVKTTGEVVLPAGRAVFENASAPSDASSTRTFPAAVAPRGISDRPVRSARTASGRTLRTQ